MNYQGRMWHEVMDSLAQAISLGDVLGSFLGAAFGFMGAYIIFRVEQRSNRRAQQRERESQLEQTFEHAMYYFESAVEGWRASITDIGLTAEQYRVEWHITHPFPMSVNVPQRSLSKMDRSHIRESFTFIFGAEHVDSLLSDFLGTTDFFEVQQELTHRTMFEALSGFKAKAETLSASGHELRMALMEKLAQRNVQGVRDATGLALNDINQGLERHVSSNKPARVPDLMEHLVNPVLKLAGRADLNQGDVIPLLIIASRSLQAFEYVKNSSNELLGVCQDYVKACTPMLAKADAFIVKTKQLRAGGT